MTTEPVDV